jgi:hypothetical protein
MQVLLSGRREVLLVQLFVSGRSSFIRVGCCFSLLCLVRVVDRVIAEVTLTPTLFGKNMPEHFGNFASVSFDLTSFGSQP